MFVRGALERMNVEQAYPAVLEPTACLRSLDDIAADLESQLGPLDEAATEGEASGVLIETTRTAQGSSVRHYRNQENGTYVGVAKRLAGQLVEARVLVMPAGRERWACIFLVSVAPIHEALSVPPPDEGTPRLQNAIWLERPTGADFARVYPRLAMEASRWGDVNLDCLVGLDGLLTCAVAAESPEGWGFGEAALSLSHQFRVGPQTRDGVDTAGGRIILPIRFRMEARGDEAAGTRHAVPGLGTRRQVFTLPLLAARRVRDRE